MLVPEWVDSRWSSGVPLKDRFIRYSVDWTEKDGAEGVAIKDIDQKILYFKPSSQQPSSLDSEVSSASGRSLVDE